jgi:hypothetical protein
MFHTLNTGSMRKVIGVGKKIILWPTFVFLTVNAGFAQSLSKSEQLYFKILSDGILKNRGKFEIVDSIIWEMGKYSKTFTSKIKRDEAEAFYWAEFAMNSSQYANKVYDTACRNLLIKLSEGCISTYKEIYTQGVWKEYRFDIFLLKGLIHLYSMNRDYAKALSALKECEEEVLKKQSKSNWELLDIYSLYSSFYNYMGLYQNEAKMNQIIKEEYTRLGLETVYDSLKLLSALHGLIKYSVDKNDLSRFLELVDEYENYFFRINFFLKPKNQYASVLEKLALLSLNYSVKYEIGRAHV